VDVFVGDEMPAESSQCILARGYAVTDQRMNEYHAFTPVQKDPSLCTSVESRHRRVVFLR